MATWSPLVRSSLPISLSRWSGLTIGARLGLAAVLCILPLGLLWTVSSSAAIAPNPQFMPAWCSFGDYGYQYAPDGSGLQLEPLDPSETYPGCLGAQTFSMYGGSAATVGYQEPVRLLFILPAMAFGYAAVARRTARTRRVAGIGVASVAVAGVLAVNVVARGGANPVSAASMGLALVLVAPLVWSRRGARATVSGMTMPPPGGYPDPQGRPPGAYPQQGAYPPGASHPAQGGYPQPGSYPPADQMAYAGPASRRAGGAIAAVVILALVSVLAVVIGLSLKVNGTTGWHNVQAWGGLAVVGGLATLAPALGGSGAAARRTWQIAACGAGALVFFWVLFVLPAVGSNASLIVTIGTAAGVAAAWFAPGRTAEADRGPQHNSW